MKEFEEKILDDFESTHTSGATSAEVVTILNQLGISFSEATLRKYVQLGLIPKSKRIGAKGKHQGSWGVYPPIVARQIVEIKKLLSEGMTMEEIREGFLCAVSALIEAKMVLEGAREKMSSEAGIEGKPYAAKLVKTKKIIEEIILRIEMEIGKLTGKEGYGKIAI